jgi:UDP-3-O-acyl-N-acetylglucosamine deacetylase
VLFATAEIPVVDGSALGWAEEIRNAGLQPSPFKSTERGEMSIERPTLHENVTVQEGESFITFYPGPVMRLSVGLNWSSTAPVVGCQWFTWSPDSQHGRDHFCSVLAPARTCYPSVEGVEALMQEGLLQGGPDFVSLIGNKDKW